jgi:small-conductance mechanosensitive channel
MKHETFFLKVVIFLVGILVLALCIFLLPWITKELGHYPSYLLYPILISMTASAIPFFIALYQTIKLLSYIDKNNTFQVLSVKSLKNIKYCAIIISILYMAISPLLYIVAEIDDAPGILLIGLIVAFASFVIAVFSSVLEHLLKNALDIKLENDLTV